MSSIRTYEITHSEQKPLLIKQKDTTDYLLGGSLGMKNGKIDKVLFEGGYAQASVATKTTDKFAFYYYNQDHLGNNREVVNASGTVTQVTNYYPFGAPYADATAVKGANVQPYKYNGKELDLMHGLNTFDYGARQLDPILCRWDRMDPLCEKYYSTSPYVYCVNNPVKFIDPDGREIRGQTRDDAQKAVEDIRAMFAAKQFDNFRNLIVQSGKKQNGKSLARIDSDALKAAFEGVNLSEDQQALVDIVVNTINSKDVHKIEYASKDGVVSDEAKTAFNPLPVFNSIIEKRGGLPTFLIANAGGGGITMKTSSGTHTVIVNSKEYHPLGRPVTTGHEIFGHGRSLALGRDDSQHVDAIQAENLILRVMNINSVNDGRNHANGAYIPNPTTLPSYR